MAEAAERAASRTAQSAERTAEITETNRNADDGRLEVAFGDGSVIRVPVSEEYEVWQLAGPRGLRIVGGPGAKLTVWPGGRG